MPRTVLDVTRLLTRASHPIATGVDRVELAYARRVLAAPNAQTGFAAIVGECVAPLPRVTVAPFVRALERKWSAGTGDDAAAQRLAGWLGGTWAAPAPRAKQADEAKRRAVKLRLDAMLAMTRPAVAAGDTYLHVSHIRLDRPAPFASLRAAGARLTVLVHDLIPIRFPEYGRAGEAERHAARMTTALTQATTLIANSHDTARDLSAFASERRLPPPPVIAAPLGVEDAFGPAAHAGALTTTKPYFVALGTIEPRKNHLLLLHVWRALAARLGADTPKLVLVGRRGWENEMVVDLLERSPAIREHVIETNDLPDDALVALMRGARALLFPSFAEGFGLPLAEALALGAPTIAADLPAFREIAGDRVEMLNPLDGPAWTAAVTDYAADPSPRREAALSRAEGFAPPTWDDHFALVRDATGLG